MRFSSWSSSSITAARGYMCSMSKWNWTPAGGSRRKFLLSWDHSAQFQERKKGASFTRGARGVASYCRQGKDLLLDCLLLVVADPGRHSCICMCMLKWVQHLGMRQRLTCRNGPLYWCCCSASIIITAQLSPSNRSTLSLTWATPKDIHANILNGLRNEWYPPGL